MPRVCFKPTLYHVVHWNAPREDIFCVWRHDFFVLRDVHLVKLMFARVYRKLKLNLICLLSRGKLTVRFVCHSTVFTKNQFIIPKTISDCKKWKLWNILSLQASTPPNLAPTTGNSLKVRGVSPGRIIVLLLWAKYVVLHQIKPRILKLAIRRGQSNISIVFICVRYAENDYYTIILYHKMAIVRNIF